MLLAPPKSRRTSSFAYRWRRGQRSATPPSSMRTAAASPWIRRRCRRAVSSRWASRPSWVATCGRAPRCLRTTFEITPSKSVARVPSNSARARAIPACTRRASERASCSSRTCFTHPTRRSTSCRRSYRPTSSATAACAPPPGARRWRQTSSTLRFRHTPTRTRSLRTAGAALSWCSLRTSPTRASESTLASSHG